MTNYVDRINSQEDRLQKAEYSIEELKTRSINQNEIAELRDATLVKLPAQEETIKDLENRLNDM